MTNLTLILLAKLVVPLTLLVSIFSKYDKSSRNANSPKLQSPFAMRPNHSKSK